MLDEDSKSNVAEMIRLGFYALGIYLCTTLAS